jgi:protein CpxP
MTARRFKILVAGLAILVAGGAVALSQTAGRQMYHHGMGGPEHHMIDFLTQRLDLTDAQQTQVKNILAQEKPTIQPLMQQVAQSRQQLMREATSGTFDEAKVRAIASQQSQAETELSVEHAKIASQVFNILTPDQKTKALQMLQNHEQHMQEHMQHMQQGQDSPEE